MVAIRSITAVVQLLFKTDVDSVCVRLSAGTRVGKAYGGGMKICIVSFLR